MSKERMAELATVKWEDALTSGWSTKQCTVSLGLHVRHQVDSHIYEQNEAEIKRYIQNQCLDRLERDVRSLVFPEVEEVANELNQLAMCCLQMEDAGYNNPMFFKGEPLYHVFERYSRKLLGKEK